MLFKCKQSFLAASTFLLLATLCIAVMRNAMRETTEPHSKPLADSREEPVAELALEKQKQIWDNEHITFEIEKRFGTAFLESVLDQDSSKVRAYLRDGFTGEQLDQTSNATRTKDFLTESRRDESSSFHSSVNAEQFADAMISLVDRFQHIERQRLKVLQIEKLSDEPQRCKAKLLIEFVGMTSDSHIAAKFTPAKSKTPPSAIGEFSRQDAVISNSPSNESTSLMYSSEHWVEFTITDEKRLAETASIDQWRVEQEIWRSSSQQLFNEVTNSVGLAETPIPDLWKRTNRDSGAGSFQIAVDDYNNDGWLDIAVALLNGKPLLLESRGGKQFHDVAAVRGLTGNRNVLELDRYVACWIDYDNDGWPDLLLGDRLYHNDHGKHFDDVTKKAGLRMHRECMGAVTADYNGDGLLDLYLLYQRDYEKPEPETLKWVGDEESGRNNQLWRNEGEGQFLDVTDESGAGGGTSHTFAASWFFFDGDHHPDLYLANDFGANVILRNRGDGTFEDVSSQSKAEDFATSMGVATGDINNDGQVDIYVANMYSKMGRRIIRQVNKTDYPDGIFEQIKGSCAGNRLYLGVDNHRYDDVSEDWGVNAVGWAFAPALFDLDGDGFLDIYAATGFMSFSRDEPDG